MKFTLTILILSLMAAASAQEADKNSQDNMASCPMHAQHGKQSDSHFTGVVERGAAHEGMGFSQTATTHHFLLTKDGGIIQVTANDPQDSKSIAEIQQHFQHIAMLFAQGDFSIPHFVHDQTPPGVRTMKKLRSQLTFTPEQMDHGAKLIISTSSPKALAAVHDFLRFQIRDHRTGDPLSLPNIN